MVLLIPAYEPDTRLVDLVVQLRSELGDAIVVVDDGSGPDYRDLFAVVRELGATVITCPVNAGKGSALRIGFRHIRNRHPGAPVVSLDCDGQHAVADVVRVAERLAAGPGALVLGARRFTGTVPLRSRVGNVLARRTFALATGVNLTDTQTGLRGYPAGMLDWLLSQKGDRFEYELTVLLAAPAAGFPIDDVPIDTIYFDGNSSSHFRPFADSVRVAWPLVAYAGSSLVSFVLDAALVLVLAALTGSLFVAAVGARLVSASVNFLLNRHVVFRGRAPRSLRRSAALYAGLAVTLLAAGWAGLELLTRTGLPLLASKVLTDVALYIVAFVVQRRVVFGGHRASTGSVTGASTGSETGERAQADTPSWSSTSSTADATSSGSRSMRR